MKGLKRSRRSKKITVRVITAAVSLLAILAILIGQVTTSAAADTTVTDESTMESWEDTIQNNTENVGRIWTDKSVFSSDSVTTPGGSVTVSKGEGADFLVALSALSSAASVTGGISSTQPLDIVLVLDRSGSMANNVMTYTEAYVESTVTSGTYYVLVDGTYYSVSYSKNGMQGQQTGWYYTTTSGGGGGQGGNNRTYVTPLASETDTTEGSVQFYTAVTSRMDALKSAVNAFIEATYEVNSNISDTTDQHRISIVSYGTDVTINAYLTYVNSENDVSSLESIVNGLTATGATRADYGLQQASSILTGDTARSDAEKVVIFFTDGEPTSGSTFEDTVANSAVSYAKIMKDSGVTIYSIGIFNGADTTTVPTISNGSSTTDKANSFMQAVSSNYPSATAYRTLGTRAENSDYYKAAADAEELEKIFEEIFSEITTAAAESPTQIEKGLGFNDSGYITFTDTLGDYMEVSGFSAIVYNDVEYTIQGEPANAQNADSTGSITTYTFTDNVAANTLEDGAQISLSNIIITVESFDDASKGDIVTVKIPASLIPLWTYEVDDNGDSTFSTTATEAFPISIFYNVKVKDAVESLLEDPDETMQAYIEANTDSEGKVRFYANKYDASDSTTVTSSFVPSSTNNFYYFQEDEILYTREGEEGNYTYTIAASSVDSDETYYYEREYYVETEEGKSAAQETYWTAVAGDSALALEGYIKTNSDNQLYIAAGTPRLSSLEERFEQDKTENATKTADYVIDPDWESDGTTVTNALGNNGYITRDVPGTLVVEKKVESAVGHTAGSTDTFTFTLTLSDTQGSYNAQIFNSNGTAEGEALTVSSGSTFTLTNGQYIKVYGLADGVTYTVTETVKTGYTAAYSVSGSGTAAAGSSGTITGGATSTVTVTNTYKAEAVTLDGFGVTKNYDSWTQTPNEVFTFILESETAGAPMPEGAADGKASITISASDAEGNTSAAKAFGSITYDTPGTYTYLIYEQRPSATTAGITYSDARYRVTVTVTDVNGQLTASAAMTQILDDSGTAPETATAANSAVFTNTFSADSVEAAILGTKSYIDSTGSKALADGMFTFRVTLDDAASGAGKYPSGVELSQDSDGNYYYTVTNTGSAFTSGAITFTGTDVGKEYTYTVQEVIPDEVKLSGTYDETANTYTYTYQGMTYDASVYTVTLTISAQTAAEGSGTVVAVTRTYTKNGQTWMTDDQGVVFTNSYDAADVTIGGSTGSGLAVTKYIGGRELNSGETFSFDLTADSATAAAVNSGSVVISGLTADSLTEADTLGTVTVSSLETASYFSDITFSRVGTYTFYIRENIPEGATAENSYTVNGLTYDTSVITATVTVTDEDGELKAAVAYSNNKNTAEFTNTYRSSAYYGNGSGLQVSKTLTGRNMNAGEFAFTITAENDNAKAKGLAAADAAFTNANQRADGIADVMTKLDTLQFTQADAGKTFTYTIRETAGSAGGVAYDATVYTVEIAVSDDGEGNITTVTTVTKNNDSTYSETYESADEEIAKVEFANTYAAEPAELTGSTDLKVEKTISGRDWLQTDEFTFTLEAGNDATRTAVSSGKVVLPDNAAGITITANSLSEGAYTAAFGDITFKETGNYVFKITEASGSISGMTYDTTPKYVYVTVTDDLEGSLTAQVTGSSDALTFANTYEAQPVVLSSLSVTKTLTGREWTDTDRFTFKLTAYNDAAADAAYVTLPAETTVTVTGETTDYSAAFGGITFSKAGTYEFRIAEADGSIPGITYDTSYIIVTVVVNDNTSSGELEITSIAYKQVCEGTETDVTGAVFTNTYSTGTVTLSGSTHLDVDKTLSGRDWTAEDSFIFTIKAADDETSKAIDEGKVVLDGNSLELTGSSSDAAGDTGTKTGSFGDIVFHEEGTYSFIVSETIPEGADDTHTLDGMTYDATEYAVIIVVTDNGEGELYIDFEESVIPDELSFSNTYTPDPADAKVDLTKTIDGRSFRSDVDVYSFTMTPAADNGPNAPVPTAYTVSNDSNGSITYTFTGITKDQVGTYVYKVTEDDTSVTGITKDSSEITVTLTVAYDETTGELTAETETSNDGFVNSYSPIATTISGFTITKSVEVTAGSAYTMSAGEFEFTVTPGAGNPLTDPIGAMTLTNAANGTVTFGADAEYIEAGTYTYTVKESAGSTHGMSYDGTVYTVVVTVTENDGRLSAVTSITDENNNSVQQLTFANTYTPDPDDPEKPGKTVEIGDGDDTCDNGEEVYVGQTLEYTISYYNNLNTASRVVVTDELDDGVDFVSASCGSVTLNSGNVSAEGTGVTIAYDSTAHTVTWTLNSVEAFSRGEVTLTVTVNENAKDAGASVENSASVTVGNQTSQVSDPVENPIVPDDPADPVKAVSSDSPSGQDGESVGVGSVIVYTIDYYNYNNKAAAITITDKLDPGVDFQSASNGGTYDEATGTVTWNLTADAFAEGTVTLNVVVNENAKQLADGETQASVENQATVIIGGNTYDTNTVVNPISPDDPEDPEKVVAADSEAGVNGESVQAGDRITFEITYYNHTNEAADVNITDVLQTGLTYISSTGGGTESAGTVTWTIRNVAPYTGGTVTVTVEVTEDALEEKEVGNYATVTIGENKADTNLVTIPVDDTPRDPVKTVDTDGDGDSSDEGAYVAVGDTLEYTIGYYNYKGSSSVIVITDELDGGVDFVDASDGGVYDPDTHTVTWTIQAAAHEEGEVALTVTVNEDARVADADGDASVENKAGIKIGNDVYRYSETVENPVEPDDPEKPGKTVDADGDGSSSDAGTAVSVGDTLVYTISYYNNLNTAADVVITDVLDSGVDFVEASDGGVYDPETHTVTWTIKDVAAFGRGEVTVTVTVNEDALTVDADGSASVENTASVTVGNQTSQSSDPVKNPVEEDEPETPEEEESETPEEEESETPEETTGDGTASGDEPDTGDSQVNLALWVIIMVAAIIGITNLTAVYIRRRKRDEDR